jgi:hypothetical protein
MPKELDENEKAEKREKGVAYYSALVNAWLQTRAEKDRSLLTISTAAIGVLISLLAAKLIDKPPTLVLFILAIFSFLVCAVAVISIFDINASHIEKVINSGEKRSGLLAALDITAYISFIIGLALTLTIGIIIGIQNLS